MASASLKISDLISTVSSAMGKMKPFKEAVERVNTPLEAGVKRYEDAIKGDIICSDDENINKLWALAKIWKQRLSDLSGKDENYWMDVSGINLFDRKTIQAAVNELNVRRSNLNDLKQASAACMDLIILLNISDHMDVKSWGSMLVSTKALDIEARKLASREFRDCSDLIDKITFILDSSIRYLGKIK